MQSMGLINNISIKDKYDEASKVNNSISQKRF